MAEKMYEVGIGVVGCGSVAEIAHFPSIKIFLKQSL